MGAVQRVENGEFVSSAAADSVASAAKKSANGKSSLDKDAFLQLLVAQMKYQDPLEPTSNTEYISQFATFSELEQMQNMSNAMDLFRASSLVGQTVLMKVTTEAGYTTTIQGNVDYVVYENGKAYLSIGGELYSMDDLDTVADEKYLAAYKLAAEYMNIYNKLPEVGMLTIEDRDNVERLDEIYSNMNEYQKSFLSDAYTNKLNDYVQRMKDLVAIAEAENGNSTGSADKVEGGKNEEVEGEDSEGEGSEE